MKKNPDWIEKLKGKWNLKNTRQVIIILIAFAFTGTTVLVIKKPLTDWLYPEGNSSPAFTIVYLILILPVYNILLLFYGFIFGQFSFFWEYEKKFFRKILGKQKIK